MSIRKHSECPPLALDCGVAATYTNTQIPIQILLQVANDTATLTYLGQLLAVTLLRRLLPASEFGPCF